MLSGRWGQPHNANSSWTQSNSCLIRGYECQYPDPTTAAPSAKASEDRPARLVKILPATPADPFDCLPVQMVSKSPELFHHYMQFRSQLRGPRSESLESTFPPLFRASLILAAAHHASSSAANPEICQTSLYHKAIVIQDITNQVMNIQTERTCKWDFDVLVLVPPWVARVVNTLLLADSANGDHQSAAPHIRGLIVLLSSRKRHASATLRLTNPGVIPDIHFGCNFQVRAMFVNLCLIAAGHRCDTVVEGDADHPTPKDRHAWTYVAYLCTHTMSEFATNIRPANLLRAREWAYSPLVQWLQQRERAQAQATTQRGPSRSPRLDREVWERSTALVAFFVTLKSMCPLPGTAQGEEGNDDAGLGHVIEKLQRKWLADPEVTVRWEVAREVIAKMEEWKEYVMEKMLLSR